MCVLRRFSLVATSTLKRLGYTLLPLLLSLVARAQNVFPGTTAVGQSSVAMSVSVTPAANGVAAQPVATTQSVLQGEFTVVPGGSCTAGASLVAGRQCTVSVVFTPSAPGLRQGAVILLDGSGNLLGEANLSGVGKGPLAVLDPGNIDTIAGDGDWTFRGDGALATYSPIFLPTGVVVDALGNLYLSDSNNNRIRRVDAATGVMTTVAGNGLLGYSGDGGPATAAMVSTPAGLTMDGAGNIYFADTGNQVIRRIDAMTGIITTVVGKGGVEGYEGDGAAATQANLSFPEAVVFDRAGNMYVADTGNSVVRQINPAGVISTVAGTGTAGYNGDGMAANAAELNQPWGLAVGLDGSLYIADLSNNRVRRMSSAGIITSVAGTGFPGFGGDGAAAAGAWLKAPAAVALDPAGNLYIADSGNNRVRKVYAVSGNIATITGADSEQFAGDRGPAVGATMYGPYALYLDAGGDLFVADLFHNRIREIYATQITELYPPMRVGKTSDPVPVPLTNDGNADLQLTQFVLNNAALDPATTTCGLTAVLTTGSDCVLGAAFAPQQVGYPINGSIAVSNNSQPTPQSPAPTIHLSGTVLSVNPTAVTLTSNLNPSLVGEGVTFSATVSGNNSLTGTVVFLNGTTPLCTVTLTGLSASCLVTTLTLGSHAITASYSGDDQDAAAVSATLTQVVKQQAALALSVSPNPANVGATVTMSVTVSSTTGSPSGQVVFYDGASALGNAPLQNGAASITTSALGLGTHTITATYAGDTSNAGGKSNAVAEVVQPSPTTTLLSTSNANVPATTPILLTAVVSNGTTTAPTGTVQFNDNGTSLGGAALSANGTATLTVSTLIPGTHSMVAVYSGDANDQASQSAALSQTVMQITTATSLTASSNPVSAGATLQLSAHVGPGQGSGGGALTGSLSFLPGGTVSFTEGANTLGVAPVDANGNAVVNVNTLMVATHNIIATYSGNTNYAGSVSTAIQVVVQVTTTSTVLNSSATNALAGEPVTLSVAVSSATGFPTGSVTLYDGATSLGSVVLNAKATGVLTTSTLAVGTHMLKAVYGGDGQYAASTSTALQQTIALATTTLTISAPSAPVNAGLTFSVTSLLGGSGIAPTGTVSLLDGGKVIATQTVTGLGTVTFAGLGLGVGTHSLSTAYSGDANNAAANSGLAVVVVQQGASTATLTASANPVTVGQSVTFTAAVNSASPNLAGTVTFSDGATLLAAIPVGASGVATYSTAALAVGQHTITATYGGDVNHAASNTVSLGELVVQASTMVLGSSNNPSVAGNAVIFTAKVSGSGAQVPTGAVTFSDGPVLLGSVMLDAAGVATVSTVSLAVGSHSITASYAGDSNYYAASGSLVQTVQSATTQMTLSSSVNPATYGQPVGFTTAITSNGGVATGSVSFTVDGKVLATALLSSNGVATLTTSSLAPGSHSVVANYAGDGRASASSSTPLTQSVLEATSIALASSANPALTLSPLVLTATVSNSQVGVPTGTTTFNDGAVQLGTAAVDANGVATLTLKQLSAGTHTITASYGGDADNFAAMSPALTETVNLQATSVTLTSVANDPTDPQSVLLIGVVHVGGTTIPTGTVTFSEGTQVLGSATVDATGVASLPVVLQPGTNSVTATYSGDSVYATSTSLATAITGGAATNFAMALSPATMTVVSKQHSLSTLTLNSIAGFTDTMEFGCLGLPYAATCTFDKPTATLGANQSLHIQLTVDTGNPLGAGAVAGRRAMRSSVLLCLLPASLLLGFGLRRRRGLISLALMMLAVFATLSATGCAGLQISGTPPGTYSFKVTASGKGTGVTQSQVMTLTVTQ